MHAEIFIERKKSMKPYRPFVVIVALLFICFLFLIAAANVWLFTDFMNLETYSYSICIPAICIVILDIALIALIIMSLKEKHDDHEIE